IAPGSATPLPYAMNWSPGMSYVSGIAIDPVTFEPVATLLTVNRIVRIAANGSFTDLVPPGSVPGPNSIDVDPAGDFIVGACFGQTHRVPRAGGSPVLFGTASGVFGAATGTAVARPPFRAVLVPRGGGAATLAITG